MQVLKYSNRKEESSYWDASTPEKEAAAYKCLFLHLKNDWHCYTDLENGSEDLVQYEKDLKELEALEASQDTIPELLKSEVKQKLEQLPRLRRTISYLKSMEGLWKRIQAGDERAIRSLLRQRQTCQYEEWEMVEVIDPIERLKELQ